MEYFRISDVLTTSARMVSILSKCVKFVKFWISRFSWCVRFRPRFQSFWALQVRCIISSGTFLIVENKVYKVDLIIRCMTWAPHNPCYQLSLHTLMFQCMKPVGCSNRYRLELVQTSKVDLESSAILSHVIPTMERFSRIDDQYPHYHWLPLRTYKHHILPCEICHPISGYRIQERRTWCVE